MIVDVDARVLDNQRLSSDYNVLTLDAPAIGEAARPGQFVMVKPRNVRDSLLRRPFSIFEVSRDGEAASAISILNKRAGENTSALYAAQPGDRVACLGPLGKPFSVVSASTAAWMVAGGVGLAPFATLAEHLAAAGVRTTLFYGARTAGELFHLEFFAKLGVHLVLATENGSQGVHGRVTVPLQDALARLSDEAAMVYACGPEPMLAAVAALAARYRQPCEVSVERVMGCGLGGCYSCVIPIRDAAGEEHFVRSCITGPVLSGAAIVWERC